MIEVRKLPLVLAASAAALGLGVHSGPVSAQGAIEEIVVTGSFIRGTPEDAALPVDIISLSDLRDRGNPSVLDLIKSLPTVGAVLGDTNQFAGAAQGTIGTGNINLRGMGGLRTLVLFNGRRTTITPAEGPGGVDTNLLPLAAVGRVEILKDGAAAIYGSDAIAGVANFITRTDLDGLELQGDFRTIDGSDGDYQVVANWGWQGENSDILVSFAHQHRSELPSVKRKWPLQPYLSNPSGWSVLGQPGIFLPFAGAAPSAGLTRDANCAEVGGYPGFTGTTPACFYSYIPFDNLVEKMDRYQAFAQLNAEIAPGINFHVEGLYATTEIPDMRFSPGYPPTSGPNGPGSVNVYFVNSLGATPFANNPGALTALQQTGLSQAQIDATDRIGMTLWRPLGGGGNNSTGGLGGQSGFREYDIKRFSASLNGTMDNGIGWDVALTYSDSQHDRMTTDIQINRLQNALNGLGGPNCNGIPFGSPGSTCLPFNPFSNAYSGNPALGLTNPGFVSANENPVELVKWLFDAPTATQEQSLAVIDAVLNGEDIGFALPAGNIGWAVGVQYRRTKYNSRTNSELGDPRITPCPVPDDTSCAFRTGPYIFLGQFLPQELDEKVRAFFAEFAIPLFEKVDMQLAVRYEDYGGLTGSTTDPKLALRWEVNDMLTLRGSVSTTFRGPTPLNRAAQGITGLQAITAANNNFKSIDFFGNPAIKPESAFSYNLGAILDVGNFRAMVDYWNFTIEDQITSVPPNTVATAVAGSGDGSQAVNCAHPLRGLITFSNNDSCVQGTTIANDIARVRADITNGPEARTSGIDVSLIYDFDDLFQGSLRVGTDISYVLEYKLDAFVLAGTLVSQGYDALGFANYDRFPGTLSEWRGTAFANFNRGNLNVRYEITYIDGVKDNRAPVSVRAGINEPNPGALLPITFGAKIDPFISNNLYVNWTLPYEVTASVSIVNLFDEDPSAARLELSYDPFIGNPLGRTIQFGLRKEFARNN